MKNKFEIKLNQLKSQVPDAPEGYFNKLEDEVISKWKNGNRSSEKTRRLIPIISVAASFCLMIMAYQITFPKEVYTEVMALLENEMEIELALDQLSISEVDEVLSELDFDLFGDDLTEEDVEPWYLLEKQN